VSKDNTAEGARLPAARGMADRALDIAAGRAQAVEPRDAATVILVRPGPDGLETFLLQRTQALDFAPGACVFPGGSVDEADADPAIAATAWAGPSPAELGALLGIPAARAGALAVAAVRETFEECGVLLATPVPGAPPPDRAILDEDQHALLHGSLSVGELLSRRRLVLRADLLTPWTRWITPEASPRRFDTWFFAAALPPGQLAALSAAAAGESDAGHWWRPSAALDAARAKTITVLPPTAVTLAELTAYQDVASVLAERRAISPLMSTVIQADGRAWLALPPAVVYPL
jgi:8-oxo-dGTP pyrophosphatase MutT (NUDIX family)